MASPVSSSKSPGGGLPQRNEPACSSEDLFDFPVVEMRHSSARTTPEPASPPAPSKAQAAATMRDEATVGDDARPGRAAREARASSAAKVAPKSALPSASVARQAATQISRPEALLAPAPERKRVRAVDPDAGRAASRERGPEVRRASAVHQEAPERDEQLVPPPLHGPTPDTRIAVAALVVFVLANLGAWLVFQRSAAEVRDSVLELRSELGSRAPSAATAAAESGATPAARERAAAGGDRSAAVPDTEELALEVARAEISTGQWAAARRRLHRVLAAVDALESPRREALEAQASFLCADSYRRAASRAPEAAR